MHARSMMNVSRRSRGTGQASLEVRKKIAKMTSSQHKAEVEEKARKMVPRYKFYQSTLVFMIFVFMSNTQII
jgi:hypothetical protein